MIKIQDVYKPLYENKEKFITLITGGRGSGKSFNAMTFIERLSFERGHKILLSRYTLSSASISVIPEFREKVELEDTNKFFTITEKDATNLFSKSEIMFRGIRTSSGNQTANLKSIQGLTTFVVDEGEEWVSEVDYEKLVLSIRTKGIQNRIIIIMNPTNINHFVYRKYLKDTHKIEYFDGVPVQISTHPNILHIHTTYLDNIENLSEEFLKEVEEVKRKDKELGTDKYATTIMGRWSDMANDLVYHNWTVVDDVPTKYIARYLGLDFGFADSPLALIDVYIVDKENIYVRELIYNTGLTLNDLSELMKSKGITNRYQIVADCADPRFIEELKRLGYRIEGAYKGADSKANGIDILQRYKINVTKDSENVIHELNNYKYILESKGKKAKVPEKDYDHALDALRYVALNKLNIQKRQSPQTMSVANLGRR